MKPTRWTIEVEGWQEQGFFGEVWSWRNQQCGRAFILPRHNFRCPDELYKTRAECRSACEAKVHELRTANNRGGRGV